MGKVYKNPHPPKTVSPFQNIPIQHVLPVKESQQAVLTGPEAFVLPKATVLPKEEFDPSFQKALALIENQEYYKALSLLLNLEVTDFNHIEVHELLADVFLHLNQLVLAKEQCQICAHLIKQNTVDDIFTIKSFDQLLAEAKDIDQLKKEFNDYAEQTITPDNFQEGVKISLQLATHHIAAQRYEEAETLLTQYRDRYLKFLDEEESS